MKKITVVVLIVAALFMGAGFVVAFTPPKLDPAEMENLQAAAPANGERIFWASGCAGCHAAPDATGEDRLVMSGGVGLTSAFGTFYAPNISPDKKEGIGDWTLLQFANAIQKGVGINGENLYPALPYTSYAHMRPQDVKDLHAYLKTLPPSSKPSKPNELQAIFSYRPGLSFWKMLYFGKGAPDEISDPSPEVKRGEYLVKGPGHCGECHTPRNILGGLEYDKWLQGGRNPGGGGMVPGITPASEEIGNWTASEIADYLETGFTPDFDSVGGDMVEVQKNMAKLPRSDLEAIGAYLKALPSS